VVDDTLIVTSKPEIIFYVPVFTITLYRGSKLIILNDLMFQLYYIAVFIFHINFSMIGMNTDLKSFFFSVDLLNYYDVDFSKMLS